MTTEQKKTILVTGASSDIAAPLLAQIDFERYKVLTTSFRGTVGEYGPGHRNFIVDFSDRAAVANFGAEIAPSGVDYLIQLHGDARLKESLLNFKDDVFDYLLNVNVASTAVLLKAILPGMIERKFGRIVLMSTASANFGGGPESFSYGLAKHSVEYMVRHLAKFYSQHNILTNCVSPGLIHTKFHTGRLGKDEAGMAARAKSVRVGRAGKVDDVARLIASLSFENEFISGENIKIDGADFV